MAGVLFYSPCGIVGLSLSMSSVRRLVGWEGGGGGGGGVLDDSNF